MQNLENSFFCPPSGRSNYPAFIFPRPPLELISVEISEETLAGLADLPHVEVIAADKQMYQIACSSCHGYNGQGTPMAPALNVQSFLIETNDQAMKAIIAQGVPNVRCGCVKIRTRNMSRSEESTPKSKFHIERLIIIGLIILGMGLILFFGIRFIRSFVGFRQQELQPNVTDVEAIRGWMTIPYIATSYNVPEEYIFEHLGLSAEGNRRKNLNQLKWTDQVERGTILETVKDAVRQYQVNHPSTSEPVHE